MTQVASALTVGDKAGLVTGVCRRCFSLSLDNHELVTVFADCGFLEPTAVCTDLPRGTDFRRLHLSVGQAVILQDRVLRIPEGHFACGFTGAKVVNLRRDHILPAISLEKQRQNIDVVVKTAIRYGRHTGAGAYLELWLTFLRQTGPNPFSMNAPEYVFFENLFGLVEALRMCDDSLTSACLDRLMGQRISPELPVDSFLCGLTAWMALTEDGRRETSVLQRCLGKHLSEARVDGTVSESREILRLAVNNIFSDAVYELIVAMVRKQNKNCLEYGTKRVIKHGGGSGTEICMGILTGFFALGHCL